MKYVYLIEHRELNHSTDRFNLVRTEAYSSRIKANSALNNIVYCNKGYDLKEDIDVFSTTIRRVDYTTLGWGLDEARVEMRMRLAINKTELR